MWFIFLIATVAIAVAALVVVWIAGKVILSIKRQYKKFEVEEEAYERAREEINKVFEKEKKDEKQIYHHFSNNLCSYRGALYGPFPYSCRAGGSRSGIYDA